jgi:predicted metal-binding membrane protein
MAFRYALSVGPLPWLLAISASAAAVMISVEEPSDLPALCGSFGPPVFAVVVASPVHIRSLTAVSAWLLMVAAMMPPLLVQPVGHVWVSTFNTRRPRALAVFGLGYAVVWFAAGTMLVPAAVLLRVLASETIASLASLALALIWSSSPAAQLARNRCHRVRRIGAFGFAADRDCFLQGVTNGVPCAAACWPWMLMPMVTGALHLVVMSAITYLLFLERLAPPRRPVWQLPPSFSTLAALIRRQKVVGSW